MSETEKAGEYTGPSPERTQEAYLFFQAFRAQVLREEAGYKMGGVFLQQEAEGHFKEFIALVAEYIGVPVSDPKARRFLAQLCIYGVKAGRREKPVTREQIVAEMANEESDFHEELTTERNFLASVVEGIPTDQLKPGMVKALKLERDLFLAEIESNRTHMNQLDADNAELEKKNAALMRENERLRRAILPFLNEFGEKHCCCGRPSQNAEGYEFDDDGNEQVFCDYCNARTALGISNEGVVKPLLDEEGEDVETPAPSGSVVTEKGG